MPFDNIELFPMTAGINAADHLTLGGCDVADLAAEFGTPLLVYDEDTLRSMCRKFLDGFTSRYSNTMVAYASKAFLNTAIAKLMAEEGMGMDVVSGGELAVMLDEIAGNKRVVQDVLVRLSPNVDPHTHAFTTTGILDSKFGFAIETGDSARAIRQAIAAPNLNLVGVHFHLGSPIFELKPYADAVNTILTYLAPFREEGLDLQEFSPGGGFAIGYTRDQPPPEISEYADTIATALKAKCAELGFGEPMMTIEPGRSIVGRAGVSLYTVGAIKDIPTVRKYVSVDGGMGDNIRPALYGSQYEAVVASRMSGAPEEVITLSGKYCESGDILIRDIEMPVMEAGDLVAIPSSGAYVPAMASNYNLNPRPAIVMVKDGSARIIRRRESYQDLMAMDVV